MCKTALSELESDGLDLGGVVVKRAQWEAFAVSLCPDGTHVNVRNESYGDERGHTYTVTVEDGIPVACTCKADEYRDEPCKHRVHVALNDILLAAARGNLLTDGGHEDTLHGEMTMCVAGEAWCLGPEGENHDRGDAESNAVDRRERAVATEGAPARPQYDRDVEPERARERKLTTAYACALADDREARADTLGLSHAECCDGESDGIECWRCYYIRETHTEEKI